MSEDFFPDLTDEQPEEGIFFHFEEIEMPDFDSGKISSWIRAVAQVHACSIKSAQYIFCSDDYLHKINLDYLDHDTLTDIITFPYSDAPNISGEIYVSVDRIEENARDRGLPMAEELRRVIIHGILHLCGYGDKTVAEAAAMRKLEDEALLLFSSLKGIN